MWSRYRNLSPCFESGDRSVKPFPGVIFDGK
jgi:hypothetical protein